MSDPNDASGYSKTDLISQGFIHTPELKALVDNTRKVADLDVAVFDAIVVAAAMPYIDHFLPCHNIKTLEVFIEVVKKI